MVRWDLRDGQPEASLGQLAVLDDACAKLADPQADHDELTRPRLCTCRAGMSGAVQDVSMPSSYRNAHAAVAAQCKDHHPERTSVVAVVCSFTIASLKPG